jgi:glycosyltransferase involved in cell wall biosynthesis
MNYKSQTVSAVVITENDAQTLEEALSSLHWVDELIVVDCGSTDGTLAIARQFTDKIHFHPTHHLTRLRRDALAMAKCDWILLVEPNEWVEEMLRHEIDGVLLNTPSNINGYTIPRKLKLQNQWLKTGESEHALRLVRRKGHWHVGEDWEASLSVKGEVGRLDRPMGCAPYRTVEDLFTAINQRSTMAAYAHLATQGVSPKDQGVVNILWRTKWAAYRQYILKGSIWNGFMGLTMTMACMCETFLKFAKIRTLTRKTV